MDAPSAMRPPRPQNASNTRTGISTRRLEGVSWPAVIVGLWLIGVLVVACRQVSSRVALIRLARSSTPLPDSGALVRQIARQMRITRPVCLRTSDEVELPFTWGIFRPQIVLPGDASEWTPDCRRHVLQHEFAHIQRVDAGTQLVAQAASALFWFHPLVWYAVGQMRCERERACDDHVLASGAVACDYASDLLALVTNYGYVERHAVALAFARRSHFEGRLLALLDPTIERGSLSPSRMATVLSLSAALVVPLATVERADARTVHATPTIVSAPVVQSAQTVASRPTPPASLPVARVASVPVAAAPRLEPSVVVQSTQSALDDIFGPCAFRSWNHQSDHSSSGDGNVSTWTASGQTDDCAFDLKSEGDIVFNGDATAIERMTPGAHLEVTTNIRGDVGQLVIRSSAAGVLSYDFARNGQRADFAQGGAVWLKQVLIGLDRTTGFAIDIRFPVLLQAGGAANVLSDVALMRADRARFLYVRRLIDAAPLDVRAIRQIGDIVSSMWFGHDAAELIVGVANQYPLVDAVARSGFLKAAISMEGDHDQARALLSIIPAATLTPEEMAAVLSSVRRMTADQQKSRVLLTLASTQRLDGDLRNAYAAAAESIRDAAASCADIGAAEVEGLNLRLRAWMLNRAGRLRVIGRGIHRVC